MPEVHRPGFWHAGGPSTSLFPGQRTIAGNAHAGSGDAGGGKGRSRFYHGQRGAGAAAGLRQSPAGTLPASTYTRKAPRCSHLKFLALGSARYGRHGRGDLNVRVIVDIPQQLNPQQWRLYEQLRAPLFDRR
jgi:hypothetical protein